MVTPECSVKFTAMIRFHEETHALTRNVNVGAMEKVKQSYSQGIKMVEKHSKSEVIWSLQGERTEGGGGEIGVKRPDYFRSQVREGEKLHTTHIRQGSALLDMGRVNSCYMEWSPWIQWKVKKPKPDISQWCISERIWGETVTGWWYNTTRLLSSL